MFSRCLLLLLVCLQTFTMARTANGASECCDEFPKRLFPAANIVSYEETRSDCSVPGVILTTNKGYRICADPEEDWVKQVISIKTSTKTKTTNENFSPYTGANGASECCFEFHRRPFPMANVVFYQETRFDCTAPGVILTTKKGYRICADPEEDWVKQIIANKNLDKT